MISKTQRADIDAVKEIEIESDLSPWTFEDYLLEIKRADSLFFVAKCNGQVVGFTLARLIMLDQCTSQFKEIELYNIAVKKEYLRRRIATDLISKIIKIAHEKNVQSIFLEVRKSNTAAQNFYKKHKFTVTGERKNFYTNPPEDAVLMSKDIKSI